MTWLAIKLFLGGAVKRLIEAAGAAFRWIVASPTHMLIFALCVSLAGNFWLYRGKARAIEQRDAWHLAFDKQKAAYIAAQREAEAKAIAAKLAQEAKDEQRRKDADNALKQALADDRRRTDDYARRMRYQAPRSAPSGTDLPSTAKTPEVDHRSSGVAELVGITRADLEICTVNSRRLLNAHDWALPDSAFGGKN